MAFLIPTNAVQIARFANGLYGLQLGFASTNGIVSDVASGGLLPTFNNYYTLSFGSQTTASVAQQILTNLGIVASPTGLSATAVSAALAYVTGQLNAAAPNARGAAVKAVFDLWSSISADPVNGPIYGAVATAWNSQISKAVQYAGAVNPDITVAAAIALPAAPNTLTLTTSTDNLIGSPTAPNQINGIFGTGVTSSFTAGDILNIAGTNNSISLTDNGTNGTFSPTGIAAITVSGIQSATISSGETLTVNTSSTTAGSQGWTGLTSLLVSDAGTTGNNTTVNAAATTDETLNISSQAATTATVTGGKNVTVNASGITTGAVTVGSATKALQPVGAVTVSTAVPAQAGQAGAVTVSGGTAISVTQAITAGAAVTANATATNGNTAGNVTVNGTAITTRL